MSRRLLFVCLAIGALSSPSTPTAGAAPAARPRPLDVAFTRVRQPVFSPDGKTIALSAQDENATMQIYLLPASGTKAPVALTSGRFSSHSPRFSPDGKRLAFVSVRSGNADIWTMDLPGGTPRRVTTDPAADRDPAWGPDGKQIVFASDRSGSSLLLYLVPASGGQVFPLSYGVGPHRRPAWSPDGQWIAFEAGEGKAAGIELMPAFGGETRRLSPPDRPEYAPGWSKEGLRVSSLSGQGKRLVRIEYDLSAEKNAEPRIAVFDVAADPAISPPAFSPAGDEMIYVEAGQRGIGLIDINKGGVSAKSILETTAIIEGLSWSPDGKRLLFVSDRDGGFDLYTLGLANGRVTLLLKTPVRERTPRWANGSDRIAYARLTATGSAIDVLDRATGAIKSIVSGPGRAGQPAWSPDDKRIAFVSDREGSDDIWIVPSGGGTPRRLTAQSGAETGPTWSADGKWIAFAAGSQLWKVPADGGGDAGADPVPITKPAQDGARAIQPAWNRKNTWIAYTRRTATASAIYLIPTGGGKTFAYYHPPDRLSTHPAWSHDAMRLAYLWHRPDRLMILDVAGGD